MFVLTDISSDKIKYKTDFMFRPTIFIIFVVSLVAGKQQHSSNKQIILKSSVLKKIFFKNHTGISLCWIQNLIWKNFQLLNWFHYSSPANIAISQ